MDGWVVEGEKKGWYGMGWDGKMGVLAGVEVYMVVNISRFSQRRGIVAQCVVSCVTTCVLPSMQ